MDTKAIDAAQVPTMQAAIETYTVNVEDQIGKIKAYSVAGVYGSAQVDTINQYIDDTATEINKIVRHFDEFKEKLAEVQAAYEAHQAAITTSAVTAASQNDEDLVTVNKMD